MKKDTAPDAYAKMVDRVLKNPHYGERMAIGWLDVVRFADTIGYHSDNPHNVWPYRDYVIKSFNDNKRFDRFTIEQIAGDFIPDANQQHPDKAIDLIDEAGSRLKMAIDSKPAELDKVDRQILQLEIERESLKKERDKASKERLAAIEGEIAELKERGNALRAQWETEKADIEEIRATKSQMDSLKTQIEQAEREANLEAAARLRYGTMVELERQLATQELRLADLQKGGSLLKEEVDAEDIAASVAHWTGIPVSKLLEGEVENWGA